jgi:uncharacterized membrane protein
MEAGTLGDRTTRVRRDGIGHGLSRLATETKASLKTSEFWAMVAVIIGILVSAAAIKGGDTGGTDEFIARQAWLYVAIVAGAYFISRGLAKSGSSEPYTVDRDGDDRGNSGH